MNTKPEQQHTESSVRNAVIERIESEKIVPTTRWVFCCMNYGVWALWCTSIILGAMSVAVILYVSVMSRHELVEASHDSYFGFLISILPYAWLVILVATGYFGYVNFRNTKTGYRHPLWVVIGSSVVVSIVLGLILYVGGLGKKIDTLLAESIPMYKSLELKERALWMMPAEGRLLGVFQYATGSRAYIVDLDDEEWEINVEDIHHDDMTTLESKKIVRVVGFLDTSRENRFHACGVFPWLYDIEAPVAIFSAERKSFLERMYAHSDAIENRLVELKEETYSSTSDRMPMGICATHAMMERIGHTFR